MENVLKKNVQEFQVYVLYKFIKMSQLSYVKATKTFKILASIQKEMGQIILWCNNMLMYFPLNVYNLWTSFFFFSILEIL